MRVVADCSALPAEGLGRVRVLTPAVQHYEKIVITCIPDREPENPFDPNEVSVTALITLPSGKRATVPGFWFQQYHRTLRNAEAQGNDRVENLDKLGQPEWRIHFSSGEAGRHRVILEIQDRSGLQRGEHGPLLVVA